MVAPIEGAGIQNLLIVQQAGPQVVPLEAINGHTTLDGVTIRNRTNEQFEVWVTSHQDQGVLTRVAHARGSVTLDLPLEENDTDVQIIDEGNNYINMVAPEDTFGLAVTA